VNSVHGKQLASVRLRFERRYRQSALGVGAKANGAAVAVLTFAVGGILKIVLSRETGYLLSPPCPRRSRAPRCKDCFG
jgi:hypothetical protein